MEESVGKFCRTVAKFCNHLQKSCGALKESVDRRPIPLDSASTTFVQTVNRRVSTAGDDLNLLESMSFAMVSFEELLGHCNEVLKKNQNDFLALQDHLHSSNKYIPPPDFDEEDAIGDSALDNFSTCISNEFKSNDTAEEDPLLDDPLSLKNFGISNVSLATIASQCDDCDTNIEMDEPDFEIGLFILDLGGARDHLNQTEDSRHRLNVSRDDYECLPKHMKGLVPWEKSVVPLGLSSIRLVAYQPEFSCSENLITGVDDLSVAVEKMNSCIATKKIKPDTFRQDEIELLELVQHRPPTKLLPSALKQDLTFCCS
ncbi:hypothetical protein OROMI_012451 [Orobanche minor]